MHHYNSNKLLIRLILFIYIILYYDSVKKIEQSTQSCIVVTTPIESRINAIIN